MLSIEGNLITHAVAAVGGAVVWHFLSTGVSAFVGGVKSLLAKELAIVRTDISGFEARLAALEAAAKGPATPPAPPAPAA